METENKDWKPKVGDVVWRFLRGDGMRLKAFKIKSFNRFAEGEKYALMEMDDTQWPIDLDSLFPTPEAALASIKIYDLEGKEVVIPRAQDKIIIEMCDRAAEQIANLSEWDDADYAQLGMAPIINAFKEIIAVRDRAAIKMVAKLVYEMNLPENPEGEARLKAAQERFKSAIGGKSDQKESK